MDEVMVKKLADWGRSRKNEALREHGPSADIPPQMDLYRDGELLAAMMMTGTQEESYNAMAMAIVGYSADRVMLLQDAYHSVFPVEPDTVNLAAMFHSNDPAERAQVNEALVVADLNRDGDDLIVSVPYIYDPKKRKFRWKLTQTMDDPVGGLPDIVRNAFLTKDMAADVVEETVSLPEDLPPQIASDILVTRLLTSKGVAIAYAAKSERIAEYLREALDRSGIGYKKI